MPHRLIDYLKKHSDKDIHLVRNHLINLGFYRDEVDEAIEEFNELRHNEEDLPLFLDPPDDE